ncbi:MAG: hypothetical protein ACP5U2_04725 [Bryobacteraceae bacterium]
MSREERVGVGVGHRGSPAQGATAPGVAVGALVSIIALALALDAARWCAVHSEIQAFVKAAAAAALRELDGTAAGYRRAREVPFRQRRQSGLASLLLREAETEFAESPQGPWRTEPEPECRCGFIRVRASATVPLFAVALLGRDDLRTVRVAAIAGGEGGSAAGSDGRLSLAATSSPDRDPVTRAAQAASNQKVGDFAQH